MEKEISDLMTEFLGMFFQDKSIVRHQECDV